MAGFHDRQAAQTREAARARIAQVYENAGTRAGVTLPLPGNLEAQIDRVMRTNGDYLDQIRQHATRNAANPGELEEFNRRFTSPGQPSPGSDPATGDSLYPDEGPDFDAKSRLASLLDSYGLGGLADWAWNMLLDGHSEATILQELRNRPEYKARFPAIDGLRQRGRAISEGEYIQIERTYVNISRAYGLPESFYDQPDDFAAFIGAEQSPAEFENRLQLWRQVADERAADPRNATTLDQLSRLYGITPDSGEWLAMVIDVKRALPALERQAAAARIGREALNTGFGQLTAGEAEGVAGSTSPESAREGFGVLAQSRELFRALPGRERSEQEIDRRSQLGAVFDGDEDALSRIRRQRARRTAEFAGGGGFASDREGVSGLGRAR